MDRTEAISWVLSMTATLRLSQAKTLAALVASAVRTARVSLANLARGMGGRTTVKHRIKRVWRFCANPRVEVSTAMEGLVGTWAARHNRRGRRRRRPLVVNLDWTDVREFKTLMASADIRGRSVPLLWATYRKWRFYKSQNNLEEGLLRRLKTLLPTGTRVVILADRGFGRTELARLCQRLGFHYVIRIEPTVWVDGRQYRGVLRDYPVYKGIARVFRNVRFRKEHPVTQHVVIRWERGLPKRRDECWYLMTDLDRSARKLAAWYGHRMTVEELFRDEKNHRNGWALRHMQLTRADRIDRLLLILAFAYALLCGIGLYLAKRYDPSTWCSNSRAETCSVFTIGRTAVDHQSELVPSVSAIFTALVTATYNAIGNWG